CEVRVMLCMTQYICAPLQSAGGFILEGDWTPTKTYLSQLTTYRGGSLIFFQDKNHNQKGMHFTQSSIPFSYLFDNFK
ncbi:MAG: hypothetical protein SOY03_09200, partial [Bariatricus sp.]|nr:hypothetical protein [Bariatricus sp.]